jgi:LTXXQ motif family protein
VYRSADEPDAADARKDCGNVIRAGATWRKRKAMIRTRLLPLALVVTLISAGGIVQASAEDDGPAAGWHHKHDAAFQPKDFCLNRFARTAGHLAYTEAKLQLTASQHALWDKWQAAVTAGAEKERDSCLASLPAKDARPTALDRDDRLQKMLAMKADNLKTARPALVALYDSLTPEQRAVFDHPRPMSRHGGFGFRPHPQQAPL